MIDEINIMNFSVVDRNEKWMSLFREKETWQR